MLSTSIERLPAPPCVSIGVPVYNGEEHIAQAIESVLAQTFGDFELIICDNASTDRTGDICRAFAERDPRIRYVRNSENVGLAGNFQRVFSLARGEYFKWFAHDDVLAPTHLERCVEMLEQSHPTVVLCFPQRAAVDYDWQLADGEHHWPSEASHSSYDRISFARLMRLQGDNFPTFAFGLARRDVWARTRLIQPVCYSDAIVATELRLLGEFREVPEPLFLNRRHRATVEFKRQRGTIRAELQHYDPKQIPRVRTRLGALSTLLRTRLKLVWGSTLSKPRKLAYTFCVLLGHAEICGLTLFDSLRRLFRDPAYGLWEAASVGLLRRSEKTLIFHRVWVFLSGLRHHDGKLLSLSLSTSTQATRESLQNYVRSRLQNRWDAHARQFLAEWSDGPGNTRQ